MHVSELPHPVAADAPSEQGFTTGNSRARLSLWFFLLAALLISYQLFFPPVTGRADNADFPIVTFPNHLIAINADTPDSRFRFIVPTYRIDPAPQRKMWTTTSEVWVIRVSVWLCELFSKDGLYDLRWAGFIHAAIWLTALGLLLPVLDRVTAPKRIAALTLTTLVFCDSMYITYLNAFFADTATVLFLLLTIVLTMRIITHTGSERWNWIGWSAASFLLVSSKAAHSLVLIPLLAFLWYWRRNLIRLGSVAAPLGIVALWFCGVAHLALATTPLYRLTAYYSQLFYQVLPNTKDPRASLRELGLDDSLVKYVGSHAYTENTGLDKPEVQRLLLQKASYPRLFAYYAKHPSETLQTLHGAFRRLSEVYVTENSGSFAPGTGHAPGESSQAWSTWSKTKRALMLRRPLVQFAYAVIPLSVLLFLAYQRRRRWPESAWLAIAGLGMFLTTECIAVCLMEVLDTVRHGLVFHLTSDILAVLLIVSMVPERWPRAIQKRLRA